MNIICIGDSLTKGYGVPKEQCWVSKLQEEFDFPITNKGVVGDTSTGILSRFTKDVIQPETTHVIIMCGTNDAIIGRGPKTIFKNIKAVIDEALEKNITPVLLTAPKIHEELASERWDKKVDYAKSTEILKELNRLIKVYALDENIPFIDIFTLMPVDFNYYTDGIHITKYGHDLIFNRLKDKLA